MTKIAPIEPGDTNFDRRYAGIVIRDNEDVIFLQRRDDKPEIVNPGMTTLFGGGVEAAEEYVSAAVRELEEELALRVRESDLRRLGFIDKIETDGSITRCCIILLETAENVRELTVFEGQGFSAGTALELASLTNVSLVAREALNALRGQAV